MAASPAPPGVPPPCLTSALSRLALSLFPASPPAADPWVVYEGKDGPGKGKHIVLVSGDEEYRSEEALPQLGEDPRQAPRVQVHGPVRHRPEDRDHQPERQQQHPRPGSPEDRRPDGDLHPLPQPAGRPDEARRRLPRRRQAGGRPADRDARVQQRRAARITRSTTGRAKDGTGRRASAGRSSARRGSTTTGRTARRAPAGSLRQGARTTRSCGASRTATSSARPTSTPCGCRCRATRKPLVLGQVVDGMKPDDQPLDRARRTTR